MTLCVVSTFCPPLINTMLECSITRSALMSPFSFGAVRHLPSWLCWGQMAPASGVSVNLPMRNSGTDTGEEGASWRSVHYLPGLRYRLWVYTCIVSWFKVGISQMRGDFLWEQRLTLQHFSELLNWTAKLEVGCNQKEKWSQHHSDLIILLVEKNKSKACQKGVSAA